MRGKNGWQCVNSEIKRGNGLVSLRNRKHVPFLYQVIETHETPSGSLGEQEILWEQELQASVSTAFSSSPKLSWEFL